MSPRRVVALLASSMVLGLAGATRNLTHEAACMEIEKTQHTIFASEPKGRGTVGLLFSCTVTFVFCVWTAVHPNIVSGESSRYRLFHKAALMAVSIVVPEGVMVCAYGEWLAAHELQKDWNRLCLEDGGKNRLCPDDVDHLGMDGAFFVVMGGLVLDSRTASAAGVTGPKATLTPAGFLKYVEEGLISKETIDKAAILDKSKANNMVKLFSSFQAIWLFASCIARWREGLPLSLLEIHVAIQVLCTLFIFVFWWSKPLDVNEPLAISLDGIGPQPDTSHNIQLCPRKDLYFTKQCPPNTIAVLSKAFYDILVNFAPTAATTTAPPVVAPSAAPVEGEGAAAILMEICFVVGAGILHTTAWNAGYPSSVERTLWRVASVGMCVFPVCCAGIAMIGGYQRDLINVMWEFHQKEMKIQELIVKVLEKTDDLAWNHSRESNGLGEPETGTLPLVSMRGPRNLQGEGNTRYHHLGDAEKSELVFDGRGWRYYLHYISCLACMGFLGCYACCVLFITVESYISLRWPPDGTFATPRWSDYWKHV